MLVMHVLCNVTGGTSTSLKTIPSLGEHWFHLCYKFFNQFWLELWPNTSHLSHLLLYFSFYICISGVGTGMDAASGWHRMLCPYILPLQAILLKRFVLYFYNGINIFCKTRLYLLFRCEYSRWVFNLITMSIIVLVSWTSHQLNLSWCYSLSLWNVLNYPVNCVVVINVLYFLIVCEFPQL